MLNRNPCALLVIDAQVGLFEGVSHPAATIARIRELVDRARERTVPVLYLQHDGDPGGTLAVGSPGWQLHPELPPGPQDVVIRKRACDSFFETTLLDELRQRAVGTVVLAGMRTERCVDTTARRSVTLGFDVVLAADGHTTSDGEVLNARQIIEHTNENLDDFGTDEHVVLVRPVAAIEF
jgi:nicotinamidase-related amidase